MCMMETDSPHPQGIFSFWRNFLLPFTLSLDFLEKKTLKWKEPSEYTTAHEHSTSRLIRECWKNTFALEERYSQKSH